METITQPAIRQDRALVALRRLDHPAVRRARRLSRAAPTIWTMAGIERSVRMPSGLAERVDRVRGDETFEHWVRHYVEAAVLERERALGLIDERQRDQIEAQDADLERGRGPGTAAPPPGG